MYFYFSVSVCGTVLVLVYCFYFHSVICPTAQSLKIIFISSLLYNNVRLDIMSGVVTWSLMPQDINKRHIKNGCGSRMIKITRVTCLFCLFLASSALIWENPESEACRPLQVSKQYFWDPQPKKENQQSVYFYLIRSLLWITSILTLIKGNIFTLYKFNKHFSKLFFHKNVRRRIRPLKIQGVDKIPKMPIMK